MAIFTGSLVLIFTLVMVSFLFSVGLLLTQVLKLDSYPNLIIWQLTWVVAIIILILLSRFFLSTYIRRRNIAHQRLMFVLSISIATVISFIIFNFSNFDVRPKYELNFNELAETDKIDIVNINDTNNTIMKTIIDVDSIGKIVAFIDNYKTGWYQLYDIIPTEDLDLVFYKGNKRIKYIAIGKEFIVVSSKYARNISLSELVHLRKILDI